jgi:hypothetical protein
VAKLEQALASGGSAATAHQAPVDPATGRAKLGGRAQRAVAEAERPVAADAPRRQAPRSAPREPAVAGVTPPEVPSSAPLAPGELTREWIDVVRPRLRGLIRALFAPVEVVGERGGAITMAAPNAAHQARCIDQLATVQQAWLDATGRAVAIEWQADGAGDTAIAPAASASAPDGESARRPSDRADTRLAIDETGEPGDIGEVHEVDDSRPALAGAESVLERVAEAFPGATRVDPPAGRG